MFRGTRRSRRFVLKSLIAAFPAALIACSSPPPAAPAKTESKPATDAKPTVAAAAPAAQPAATKPAEAAKPVAGAGIGGAQATAIPTPSGTETNPMAFKAPKVKAVSPAARKSVARRDIALCRCDKHVCNIDHSKGEKLCQFCRNGIHG